MGASQPRYGFIFLRLKLKSAIGRSLSVDISVNIKAKNKILTWHKNLGAQIQCITNITTPYLDIDARI